MTDEDKEIKKKFEAFQKKLKETALGINYLKPEAKTEFVELAKEDYGNDYGVTIQELLKIRKGFYPTGHEEIEAKINLLADEIKKLRIEFDAHMESQSENPDTPEGYHKSADGSKLIKDS